MSDLAEFIRDWTLFDPVDATAGLPKSATKVQPTKIRSWKLKRVHFTLDPTLLVSLERRLDQLPLHQPAPTDIGQPNSDVGTIWEEPHVVALLDSELIPTVRRLLHRNGILRAWQTFTNSRESGIPDLFLIDEEITLALSKIEPVRFGEIKTGRHLRTVVKNLFLWLQRRGELVTNVTSLGKTSLEMDQCYGDLGDDTTAVIRERTDKLLNQVGLSPLHALRYTDPL